MSAENVTISSAQDLEALRGRLSSEIKKDQAVITVCGGTGCRAIGSLELAEALSK
jgi:hypothetical protein